jgi:hypothetical protein
MSRQPLYRPWAIDEDEKLLASRWQVRSRNCLSASIGVGAPPKKARRGGCRRAGKDGRGERRLATGTLTASCAALLHHAAEFGLRGSSRSASPAADTPRVDST